MNKSNFKWIYQRESNKKIRIYYLANDLYDKYKDSGSKKDPDYIDGIEWEPFMLYIIPSGFQNHYHCIVETAENEGGTYHFLEKKDVMNRFKINLK